MSNKVRPSSTGLG